MYWRLWCSCHWHLFTYLKDETELKVTPACRAILLTARIASSKVFNYKLQNGPFRSISFLCGDPFSPPVFFANRNRVVDFDALPHGLHLTDELKVSSLHITFSSEADWNMLQQQDFLPRMGLQYHWQNQGYATFDDFLMDLRQSKRKSIRQVNLGALTQEYCIDKIAVYHKRNFNNGPC